MAKQFAGWEDFVFDWSLMDFMAMYVEPVDAGN